MNTTILARSPPAGFFVCPKLSNKQGEEHMNDIFENTETMQENEHPRFYTAESKRTFGVIPKPPQCADAVMLSRCG